MGNDSNKKDNNNNEESLISQYNLDSLNNLISKGEYSNIYKSIINNETLSIKVINKKKILEKLNNINDNELENIIQEKLNLMKLYQSKCECSIKIIKEINTKNYFYFIMEYCDCNLKEYYNKEKELDLIKIKNIFNEFNTILTVMEENKSFHGDIKPEHILIKEKNENNIIPILTDYFNFNFQIKNYSLYTAPEIISNNSEKYKFDIKSDLWSIGLILYELYFNKLPFNSKDELLNIIKNNKSINLPESDKDKDFIDLIQKLLKINIDERISFDEYINHNFWNTSKKKAIQISVPNMNENNYDNETFNKKEVIFEFKTDKYEKELNNFTKKDLKEIEVFKYSGHASKKQVLKDDFIMKWLSKLTFNNLLKIDLSGNDFENIEGLSKLEMNLLTDLYLNNNKINNITELSKVKFENLTLLDLSENQINSIECLINANFEYLSILNLSENKISNISPFGDISFSYLTILNLGFNKIKSIDILSNVSFTNLTILYLNNNQIENINVFNNTPFESLEILNLNSNNIKNIDCLKNAKLKMLKELNLSFNKIEEIKILNSVPFINLETLNISFNKISKIDVLENIKLKSIKKICLYGNNEINYDSLIVKDIIDELKQKKINII